jgi:hypothetical protein
MIERRKVVKMNYQTYNLNMWAGMPTLVVSPVFTTIGICEKHVSTA